VRSCWKATTPSPAAFAKPARYSATPPELRRGAPGLGEHGDEILRELGLSRDEIGNLRQREVVGRGSGLSAAA